MNRSFARPMSIHPDDELQAGVAGNEAARESLERVRAALFAPVVLDDQGAYRITFHRAVSQKRQSVEGP